MTERDEAAPELGFWWMFLSIAAGSMSLISVIQKMLNIGVSGVLASLLDFYRAIFYPLTYPIYSVLSHVLPFHLPEWYRDLFLLAFLLSLVGMRVVPDVTGQKETLNPIAQNIVNVLSALLLAVPLIGLATPLFMIIAAVSDPSRRSGAANDLARFLISLGCMGAVAIGFFLLNG